jgi:hypothetical protein
MIIELLGEKHGAVLGKPRTERTITKGRDTKGNPIIIKEGGGEMDGDLQEIARKIIKMRHDEKVKKDEKNKKDEKIKEDAKNKKDEEKYDKKYDAGLICQRWYEYIGKTQEKGRQERGKFLSREISNDFIDIIIETLRYKKATNEEINRAIRRIDSKFRFFNLHELYFGELKATKEGFPLIKSLSSNPMYFIAAYFCAFVADKYIHKAIDLLELSPEYDKKIHKGGVIVRDAQKTSSKHSELQIDICEFFYEIIKEYKELEINYNLSIANMIITFSRIEKGTNFLLYHFDKMKNSPMLESQVYIFMRLIVSEALNAGEENYGEYFNIKAFRDVMRRFDMFGAEPSAKGIIKDEELKYTLTKFLHYYYQEFSHAIYNLSPRPQIRWYDSLKFDWELDNLHERSIEDLSDEEIIELGIKSGKLTKIVELSDEDMEKMKRGDYSETLSEKGMKGVPHTVKYILSEHMDNILPLALTYENGIISPTACEEDFYCETNTELDKSNDEILKEYEDTLIEKYFKN